MTQKVIDNVGTLTTPKLMMQAIDDNFDELYEGAGKVNTFVSVEDYGATGDGVTDDATAIQNAIDAAQAAGKYVAFTKGKVYYIATGLTMKHGYTTGDTIKFSPLLIGNNATIKPAGSGLTALSIIPRCAVADKATGNGTVITDISGLTFDMSLGATTSSAINIGKYMFWCDSFEYSKVSDILVLNSNHTSAVQVMEARHFVFKNIIIRGGTFKIRGAGYNTFCGDLIFYSCEFVQGVTAEPIVITSGNASTNAQVRGIRFNSCTVYGGGSLIHTDGINSQTGDIWFNACQFDGPDASAGVTALNVGAANTGHIFQIHVSDCYFVNYTGFAIYFHTSVDATIDQSIVSGCSVSLISGMTAAIRGIDVEGLILSNNVFDNITCTCIIELEDCVNLLASNNVAANCTATSGLAIGGASTNYTVIGNMFDCSIVVNDWSTGTPVRQVINNLKI